MMKIIGGIKVNDMEMETVIMEALNKVLENPSIVIAPGDDLGEFGLDSLRTIQLIVELEQNFDLAFNDDELMFENFSSISKIVSQIKAKRM